MPDVETFTPVVLTYKGEALQAKMQTGEKLVISKVVIGDGTLSPDQDKKDLTALINQIPTRITGGAGNDTIADIVENTRVSETITALRISIKNGDRAFFLREIGIIAQDPDDGEILYAYTNAGNGAGSIPAFDGTQIVIRNFTLLTRISTNIEVEANVTLAPEVSPEEFHAFVDKVDKILTTENTEAWKGAADHAKLTSGNPHKVTAKDVGLENVTNESKATMFKNAALTGLPTAPTAGKQTNNTQIATTAFVQLVTDIVKTELTQLINKVAKNAMDVVYATLLMSESSYATWERDTDTAFMISYSQYQDEVYDLGIRVVGPSIQLPRATSATVFAVSIADTSGDESEIYNTQGLLYPDGTVYARTRYLWSTAGGTPQDPKFNPWTTDDYHVTRNTFQRHTM